MPLKSWLPIPPSSPFSLANIPFGIISTPQSKAPRPAVAIGDHALDLAVFSSSRGFSQLPSILPHLSVFLQPTLNDFAALGQPLHRQVRRYLQNVFQENTEFPTLLKTHPSLQEKSIFPLKDVMTYLPFLIGDYTDFYVGKNHAQNAGSLFRSSDEALSPNYTHLPVGYHGRASSVVVSGTPIRRPWGQMLENPKVDAKTPIFAPTRRMDFELELGAFVCRANAMGEPVNLDEANESLFGLVLMNDWSARDIQGWEYVPLGPFNGKNFGTSVSAWVVLADALEPFATKGLENSTKLLPYLESKNKEDVYNLNLQVDLTTKSGQTTTIVRSNAKNLLFSFPQMLTHHSVGGCPMRVGDLLGSGTVSGTESGSEGCLLEQTKNGASNIKLKGDEERIFLEDYDVIALKGWAGTEGEFVGFGECVGRIEPAISK